MHADISGTVTTNKLNFRLSAREAMSKSGISHNQFIIDLILGNMIRRSYILDIRWDLG